MEKRYRALRLVGTIYKILGAIILVLAIVGAIVACAAGVLGGQALSNFSQNYGYNLRSFTGVLGGVISALITLIAGGIGGLTLFATGEAIYLLMDIEENTRAARLAVQPPVTPVS